MEFLKENLAYQKLQFINIFIVELKLDAQMAKQRLHYKTN